MEKLEKGREYDTDNLRFVAWTGGEDTTGYSAWAYFDDDGRYLGPDQHGIEPLFEEITP